MTQSATNFGRDISCLDGLNTTGFASGARLVAEADYRRLTTPRGSLRGSEDEQNYGLDLADMIGSANTAADAAALPGRIQTELMKDERHNSVSATVVRDTSTAFESWTVTINATTDAGPFTLQLAVSAVTIDLIGITT